MCEVEAAWGAEFRQELCSGSGPMLQVRVMPNMPCLIRQAASAFVMGNSTNQQDLQRVIMLLSAVGEASQKHPAALSPMRSGGHNVTAGSQRLDSHR